VVLVRMVAFALLKRIFVLCFHVATANINSVQLIASDATVKEFLAAGFGIKRPLGSHLHDWHGERPVLIADQEVRPVPSLGIQRNALFFASLGSEVRGSLPVLWVFTGKINVLAIGTENLLESVLVKLFGRRDERVGSLLRGVEGFATDGNRTRGRFCGSCGRLLRSQATGQ